MNKRELPVNSTNIPSGWPRPYYIHPSTNKPAFVQWISQHAGPMQINECSADKLYTAGVYNLCSCCGHHMIQGVVIDINWCNKSFPNLPEDKKEFARQSRHEPVPPNLGMYDVAYGSPLCYRCALASTKMCPYFGTLTDLYGDTLQWIVVTDPSQYESDKETGAISIYQPQTLERITTAHIRADLAQGRNHLTDITPEMLPTQKWPDAWKDPETISQPSMKVPHEKISEHLLDTQTTS